MEHLFECNVAADGKWEWGSSDSGIVKGMSTGIRLSCFKKAGTIVETELQL